MGQQFDFSAVLLDDGGAVNGGLHRQEGDFVTLEEEEEIFMFDNDSPFCLLVMMSLWNRQGFTLCLKVFVTMLTENLQPQGNEMRTSPFLIQTDN